MGKLKTASLIFDALSLTLVLIYILKRGLREKLVGFCADGASNMQGKS